MGNETNKIFFALLRSAIRGTALTEEERALFSQERLTELYREAKRHDVAHLFASGLDINSLVQNDEIACEIVKAFYRYEQMNCVYSDLCNALEERGIPFLPLKGSVIRKYYPEPWMRTSCDIDILVHREHLEQAISHLVEALEYTERERATHDVSLFSKNGVHVELHFDLVEEGRANRANDVLCDVWENVKLKDGYSFFYEMSDDFFYFYHIAHMAKHFESGGCGIRPFIDLWILDNIEGADTERRNTLLERGGLLRFADISRRLSLCWLSNEPMSDVLLKMQDYVLCGGVYGTTQNKVALQRQRKGGRVRYLISRIFVPYSKLKRYYPILEKHPWLMPVMQVRRWFMLTNPNVAKMAKSEISLNKSLDKAKADEMNAFLFEMGL